MNINVSTQRLPIDSHVAAEFWPSSNRLSAQSYAAPVATRTAANLFELFTNDLSSLISGACQVDCTAQAFFSALPMERIRLRRIALGLAEAARGCLPFLPTALNAEGIMLPLVRVTLIDTMLRPIRPDRYGRIPPEPRGMLGVRTATTLKHVAQHFSTALTSTAEDARLLGSDRLEHALISWAGIWDDFLSDLRVQGQHYRAQAYAADYDSDSRPRWQTA